MRNVKFQNATEASETVRMAAEAAALGIWDLDVQTGELHWSERCREIFGVPPEAALHYQDFLDRLEPEARESVHQVVQSALDPEGTGQYDIEYKIVRPDGSVRWAAAKGRAFFAEVNGRRAAVRFIGTILDCTEQRMSQQALIQAEQMAATGRLAASIAHEINNPLEAVTNLIFLARHEAEGPQREAYLLQAETELARVSEITATTLHFHRNRDGDTTVDVSSLTRSVLNLFHGRLTVCRMEVRTELEDGACVHAAQGELRQVIVNLIDNATDATPRGGRLWLRTRKLSRCLGDRPGVSLAIADTGSGMTAEVMRRISEPFFTTKGSSGTGLGLWLSMEIVRKFGFQLRVKSRPGRGTVFLLLMPSQRA